MPETPRYPHLIKTEQGELQPWYKRSQREQPPLDGYHALEPETWLDAQRTHRAQVETRWLTQHFPVVREADGTIPIEVGHGAVEVPPWVHEFHAELALAWQAYESLSRLFPNHQAPDQELSVRYTQLLARLAHEIERTLSQLILHRDLDALSAAEIKRHLRVADYRKVLRSPIDYTVYPEAIIDLGPDAVTLVDSYQHLVELRSVGGLTPDQEHQWEWCVYYQQQRVMEFAHALLGAGAASWETVLAVLEACDLDPAQLDSLREQEDSD